MEDLRELDEAAVSRFRELEAENADLSASVARLEEVDRLKDEFLAMVSHELRTPITVVLGMAQTLVGRPDMAATADGQEILQRVVRQGNACATSTTRKVGGVGLGLFLVDRLVRGMGGRVWVEDNRGGGARLVVELPDQAPV
jgi:signal transduction histidine kinase